MGLNKEKNVLYFHFLVMYTPDILFCKARIDGCMTYNIWQTRSHISHPHAFLPDEMTQEIIALFLSV